MVSFLNTSNIDSFNFSSARGIFHWAESRDSTKLDIDRIWKQVIPNHLQTYKTTAPSIDSTWAENLDFISAIDDSRPWLLLVVIPRTFLNWNKPFASDAFKIPCSNGNSFASIKPVSKSVKNSFSFSIPKSANSSETTATTSPIFNSLVKLPAIPTLITNRYLLSRKVFVKWKEVNVVPIPVVNISISISCVRYFLSKWSDSSTNSSSSASNFTSSQVAATIKILILQF